MSVPLKVDHGETGLALSSIDVDHEIKVWFNFYTNRAIGVTRPAALDGVFRFYSIEDSALAPGQLSAPPWNGDPSSPRDLSNWRGDILELSDVPGRSADAQLHTIQDAPWTWPLAHHDIRLILDGYWSIDFSVDFPVAVPSIMLAGTWTLEQDYR